MQKIGSKAKIHHSGIIKYCITNNATPEKALWRAVIAQAVEDAILISAQRKKRAAKRAAIKWLLSSDKDFEAVCELAGLKKADIINVTKDILK